MSESHLIVFLDCGAETAVKRKREMTIDQARDLNEAYIYIFYRLCKVPSIRLDSTSPINEMVNIIKFALGR